MASIVKVDTIQNQSGANIISESSNTITVGASGDTITIPSGATITNSGTFKILLSACIVENKKITKTVFKKLFISFIECFQKIIKRAFKSFMINFIHFFFNF